MWKAAGIVVKLRPLAIGLAEHDFVVNQVEDAFAVFGEVASFLQVGFHTEFTAGPPALALALENTLQAGVAAFRGLKWRRHRVWFRGTEGHGLGPSIYTIREIRASGQENET